MLLKKKLSKTKMRNYLDSQPKTTTYQS